MATTKIYGESYELDPHSEKLADAYAFKGKLIDDKPNGKFIGFATMEDGSVVACYKPGPLKLIIIIVVAVLAVIGGIAAFLLFGQPKDVVIQGAGAPVTLKRGDDATVISYNGFTTASDGALDLNFQNGVEQANITITGEGIDTVSLTVAPNELLSTVPITFTTTNGLVPAKLTISTATSTSEQDIVIEIPENNTPNSPSGVMDGYWKGEYIYEPTYRTE